MDLRRSLDKMPFVTSSVLLSSFVMKPRFELPNPVHRKDRETVSLSGQCTRERKGREYRKANCMSQSGKGRFWT
jgi:hypothetical protein